MLYWSNMHCTKEGKERGLRRGLQGLPWLGLEEEEEGAGGARELLLTSLPPLSPFFFFQTFFVCTPSTFLPLLLRFPSLPLNAP